MKGKATILLSGLVAILMVTCVVPFMASEDSDALVGTTPGMSLNTNSAVLYENNGTSSIQLSITQYISGDNPAAAHWYLHDIDDGTDFVDLSVSTGSSTTVSVIGLDAGVEVASVEVVASIDVVDGNNQPVIDPNTHQQVKHTASAVIVVYPSPTTTATAFHYYFKVDQSAVNYLLLNEDITYGDLALDPPGESEIYAGFWVTVTLEDTEMNASDFNALSALEWYLDEEGWDNDIGNYGWINTLLGLGSYMGPANGDGYVWYYWAQYHAVGNGDNESWEFNNTTLEFITTVGESYIGMIFWGSPDADSAPDFPGYPVE